MNKPIKIAFFDYKEYDKSSFDKIFNKDEYVIDYFNVLLNKDTVLLAKDHDVVCCFVNDKVDKDVIDKLYEYKIDCLLLRCAGYNNVDMKYAFKKVHVYTVPAYAPEAISEHTFALLLTLIRKINKAYNRVRDFNFSLNGLVGFNLKGKTIGVIGTGRIGRGVIDIANGFKMNVLAYDLYQDSSLNCQYVPLLELFQKSDIITLHAPLTNDNYHMINDNSINMMKDGVIIINTSRGGLINSGSLLKGLESKKVGGAALDVYEEESDVFFVDKSIEGISDNVLALLISMQNVIVTSHQAYLTKEALEEIAKTTLSNIKMHFDKTFNNNEICYKCKGENKTCIKERKKNCW